MYGLSWTSLIWPVSAEVDDDDSPPAALKGAAPAEARPRPRDVGAAGADLRRELGVCEASSLARTIRDVAADPSTPRPPGD
jgi:hypothetical protein